MSFSQSVISKLTQFLIATTLFSSHSVLASLPSALPDSADGSELCTFDDSQIESDADGQIFALVEVSDQDTQEVELHEIPLQYCNSIDADADPAQLKTGTVRVLYAAGGEYSGGNFVPVPKKKRK